MKSHLFRWILEIYLVSFIHSPLSGFSSGSSLTEVETKSKRKRNKNKKTWSESGDRARFALFSPSVPNHLTVVHLPDP
ncbi:hypothetical protein QBC32DRAFT_347040 [Pseudoneurospora amorphoporcata]|uniref:Secreted protein n=1 Tax=Pseudoneurospora amorphoporcata TaxID=241081 RepID=A0AAN6NQN2_9PEZI|nr:hypothetical protein QBC32DRAFT_347040 [Pseudoneurospora amorphoporcata]